MHSLTLHGAANLPFAPCTYSKGTSVGWLAFVEAFNAVLRQRFGESEGRFVSIPSVLHPFGDGYEVTTRLGDEVLAAFAIGDLRAEAFSFILFPTGNVQIGIRCPVASFSIESIEDVSAKLESLNVEFGICAALIYDAALAALEQSGGRVSFFDGNRAANYESAVSLLRSMGADRLADVRLGRVANKLRGDGLEKEFDGFTIDIFPIWPRQAFCGDWDVLRGEFRKSNDALRAERERNQIAYEYVIAENEKFRELTLICLSIYYTSYWLYRYARGMVETVMASRLRQVSHSGSGDIATFRLFANLYGSQAEPLCVSMNQDLVPFIDDCYERWGIERYQASVMSFSARLKEEIESINFESARRQRRFFSVFIFGVTLLTAISTLVPVLDVEKIHETSQRAIFGVSLLLLFSICAYWLYPLLVEKIEKSTYSSREIRMQRRGR